MVQHIISIKVSEFFALVKRAQFYTIPTSQPRLYLTTGTVARNQTLPISGKK